MICGNARQFGVLGPAPRSFLGPQPAAEDVGVWNLVGRGAFANGIDNWSVAESFQPIPPSWPALLPVRPTRRRPYGILQGSRGWADSVNESVRESLPTPKRGERR